MSKMIRVESCGNCPIKSNGIYKDSYKFCVDLMHIHFKKIPLKSELYTIKDHSKILPNCPLEDYPKTQRDDEREG